MRPPKWAKLESTGITEKGNAGYRLKVAWWYVPILFIQALFARPNPPYYHIPDSCDGLEITEVTF